jgi:predicted phage terminase large subunit-like protein
MTPEDIAEYKTDYLAFVKYIHQATTGEPFKDAPFHRIICDALESVVAGYLPRLIINIAPRSGKSTIGVIDFLAWCMGSWSDSEFIVASYSKRLAAAHTYKTRALMCHPAYQAIFGPSQFAEDSVAKDEMRTLSGGLIYATGCEGTITGYGFSKMRDEFGGACIIDDPQKPIDANSEIMRQSTIDWFCSTMESRANKPNSPTILICQRLSPSDLAGWLLSGANGEKWHNIIIPALNENDESFWPEQFPAEDLKRLRTVKPFEYSSQYQQSPVIQGGNIVKGAWFKRYDQLPAQLEYRAIFSDTSNKTKERNDFTVFQLFGVKDGVIYLIDMLRGKWPAGGALTEKAKDFWNKHQAADRVLNGQLRRMYVEDAASGTGVIADLQNGTGIPIKGIIRARDKYTRLCDVLGYLESGRVALPRSAPWVSDYIAEMEAFSADDSHDHDDMIDPTIDAINTMLVDKPKLATWNNPALFT